MARRRQLSPFNLAFLDIMFCGFGAVVLLVLLVNSQTVRSRNELHEDLRAEVQKLTREVTAGSLYLDELKAGLEEGAREMTSVRKKIKDSQAEKIRLSGEMSTKSGKGQSIKNDIGKLAASLRQKEAEKNKLAAKSASAATKGNKARRFEGEGHRQYLTGLKLGGRRVLILVDGSASMLDTSVVNVIRLRNMKKSVQLRALKWRQVQKTVQWIIANLPSSTTFQLMSFSTKVDNLTAGKWMTAGDPKVTAMLARFTQTVPAGGTSLENAFIGAAALGPKPDNIILLTDGLPTQGQKKPRQSLISSRQRVALFSKAISKLPSRVPVNTILFPMEGDPRAAVLFWKLAHDTHGSLFTPTTDWP